MTSSSFYFFFVSLWLFSRKVLSFFCINLILIPFPVIILVKKKKSGKMGKINQRHKRQKSRPAKRRSVFVVGGSRDWWLRTATAPREVKYETKLQVLLYRETPLSPLADMRAGGWRGVSCDRCTGRGSGKNLEEGKVMKNWRRGGERPVCQEPMFWEACRRRWVLSGR